jgi:hypothetical protein
MRNFQLSALMLIVALTLHSQHAQAQQTAPNAENAQANNSPLREKAFTVLESLAGQLNTLQSAENRARIGANIAESLWSRDPARARSLFLMVQDDIKSNLSITDVENPKQTHRFTVFLKLRSDTVERIAKFDGELAFSFFMNTYVDLEKLPYYVTEDQRSFDAQLAQKFARQSPDLAVRLARESLERELSGQVLGVLYRLRTHKPQLLVLYKAIVEKLRDSKLAEGWEARQFTASLVQTLQPPAIDESAFKELTGLIVQTALQNGCGEKSPPEDKVDFCHWAASTLASVEKFDSRAGRLKRWAPDEEPESVMPAVTADLAELMDEGTAQEMLALVEKYPEATEEIYLSAMDKARRDGDVDQMKKIASDFKGNDRKRELLLEEVAHAEQSIDVTEQQLAEMQTKLNEMPPERRVQSLMMAAYQIAPANQKTALKLLNQADQLADMMEPGKQQAEFKISLAMLYCLEKDDRGFAIIESLLPKLNSLVDAAVKLDGYDTSYVRDGEWNMSANGSIGQLLTLMSEGAAFFAWSDFDRAISLTGQFDRAEIRMMAQLKLAQAILGGPHKRRLLP